MLLLPLTYVDILAEEEIKGVKKNDSLTIANTKIVYKKARKLQAKNAKKMSKVYEIIENQDCPMSESSRSNISNILEQIIKSTNSKEYDKSVAWNAYGYIYYCQEEYANAVMAYENVVNNTKVTYPIRDAALEAIAKLELVIEKNNYLAVADYCESNESGKVSSCVIDDESAMYSGGFKNGEPDGQGTYTFFQGGRYEGEFRDGQSNGQGIYFYVGGDKYEGDFKNGKFEGYGIKETTDGFKVIGEFKNDKKHGYATMYYPSGDIYQGKFLEGKKNGKGICKLSQQTLQELEQGEWRRPDNLEKGQNIFECEYKMNELQYANKPGNWFSELAAGLLGAAIEGAILGSMMEPCVPDVKSKRQKIPGYGTKTTTTIETCASPYQFK